MKKKLGQKKLLIWGNVALTNVFYTQVDTTFFTPQYSFQTSDHLTKLEFAV